MIVRYSHALFVGPIEKGFADMTRDFVAHLRAQKVEK
jgi:hypothetical protein